MELSDNNNIETDQLIEHTTDLFRENYAVLSRQVPKNKNSQFLNTRC